MQIIRGVVSTRAAAMSATLWSGKKSCSQVWPRSSAGSAAARHPAAKGTAWAERRTCRVAMTMVMAAPGLTGSGGLLKLAIWAGGASARAVSLVAMPTRSKASWNCP